MLKNYKNKQGGLIPVIIVIVIALLIMYYYDLTIRGIFYWLRDLFYAVW